MEHVIEEATSLPFHGVHIPALKQVKALKARLVEEERIKQQLKDAVGNRDLDELVVAVQAAETLAPPLEDPVVGEANGLIELIREEIAVKKALKEAINNRDKAALDTLLEKAKVLNIDSEEVKQAASLKARIEEEESLSTRGRTPLPAPAAERKISTTRSLSRLPPPAPIVLGGPS